MSLPSRPTRSRYNSPFGPGSAFHADRPELQRTTSENAKTNADSERPKTLLEKWVEPSLAPPRPSFAEAGIERHGVVANMSALGALPTAKVIKAAASAMDAGGRGAAGKKTTPSASTPGESSATANATPEPTAIPSRPSSSHTKAEESTPAPTPAPAAESTTEPTPLPAEVLGPTPPPAPAPLSVMTTPTFLPVHIPQAAPQTPQHQVSPRRYVPPMGTMQQKMGQGVFALARPSPPMPYQVAPPVVASMPQMPRFQPPTGGMINVEFTDKIVEAAVQQAIDEERWHTAWALRNLYDAYRQTNPRMVRLIDAVYTQTADAEEIQQFTNVMKHKKKEVKREDAEYFFCGDGSDLPPKTHSSAANAQASTYSTPSARSGSHARTMSDAQPRRSSFAFSSVSASPHKEYEQHVSKKHKGNNFLSSNIEMNGNASAENGVKDKTPRKQSHGQQNGTSNSGGRERRRSMSSLSSLSSVDEQVLDGGEYTDAGDSSGIPRDSQNDTAGRASGIGGVAAPTQAHHRSTPYANAKNSASAETHARSEARNQPGPIIAPTTKGPKTYTFSTVTTSSPSLSSSTNNHANAANSGHRPNSSANNSMAPAALLPSATISSTSYQPPPSIVFKTKKDLNKASARPSNDENDSSAGRMKRDARKVTEKNTSRVESFERGRQRHQISLPLLAEFESASDGGDSVAPKRGTKLRLVNNNKKTTRQSAINYDSDSLSSPTALSFAPDIAPGSLSVSRAGTPNALNRPTKRAKTGTGLRVKTSPMKKKGGGTLAGIPRASGERNSPVGNGAPSNNQDENDDYCSSCGGNGVLVCCDGCTRAFHYKCIDPPMSEDALPDSAWYCNVCDSKVNPPMVDDESGSFGLLLAHLHRKNPSAFHLPKDIREYFDNVKTGAEGEYEEPVQPKAKNRAGYDEAPDYFRLKDSKGKTILCHLCHGAASAPDRAIIPCTYCGLYWHLDCLDTPMAKEPAPGRPFRCPAHVDDLLAAIPENLGPAHRLRKIKGASVIKPAISRGLLNNGDIEIENDPTDDEEELGFYEQREYGHTYKLPELGIKLDFISQVRQKTGGGCAPARLISHKPAAQRKASPDWNVRNIQEKQAALNLAALCMSAPESGDVTSLVDALMAQAPPAVVAMIAQGDADKLAQGNISDDRERNSLLALKALIESKLASHPTPQPEHQAEQVATPASTAADKVKDETIATIEDDDDVAMEL